MITYQNDLSNLSYTNKDFAAIFPELLDVVKKLSYKWDPSLSDESDPGVILLKLAALMADKCNYNIDKNVLELFPLSVTQLSNARQLFDQCGYTMRHFSSATTKLKLRLIVEPELTESDLSDFSQRVGGEVLTLNDIKSDKQYVRFYTIPRFTMFSDTDNEIIYTSIEEARLDSLGTIAAVDVIQGVVADYAVNGSTNITSTALDSDNRLYFPATNIPENGIFISNADAPDGEFWEAKDNLLIHPIGSRIYKFGITSDGKRCYVEFPSDIASLMASGLNVRYVTTSGSDGNIGKKFIKRFFNDTLCTRTIANFSGEQTDVELTTDNVYIVNDEAAVNGRDPETIESAYRNYQKTKNTFNTLVSTKDYSNFFQSSKRYSNCFVCDRSDDLQSSYSVLNNIDGADQLIPFVRKTAKTLNVQDQYGEMVTINTQTDEMTAFDLRVYGLKYIDGIVTPQAFSSTFELEADATKARNFLDAESVKCLSHDYLPFEKNRIIMLKNKYPLVGKIVSANKLTYSQIDDILNNVRLALFQLLNSQVVSFGEEIDYNVVYNTILHADSRISAVALNDIKYETDAVYIDENNKVCALRIDAESKEPEEAEKKALWNSFRSEIYAKSILSGKTPLFIPNNTFLYSLGHEAVADEVTYQVEKITSQTTIPMSLSRTANDSTECYISNTLRPNDTIMLTSPNLVEDQNYSNYCQYITNIGIGYNRHVPNPLGTEYDDVPVVRPNYDDTSEVVVAKNTDYILKQDEYIIFFWRTTEDDTEKFTYIKYTGRDAENPCIIRPSFNLCKQPHVDYIGGKNYKIEDDFFLTLGDKSSKEVEGIKLELVGQYPKVASDSAPLIDVNEFVKKYVVGEKYNVKTNSIVVQKINKIHLNNTTNGSNKFFWILNEKTSVNINGTTKFVYRLFSDDEGDTEYTLKDGEQLIYSDPGLTQFYILGTGTKIERQVSDNPVAWDCTALEHTNEFMLEGPTYFENSDHQWFDITVSDPGSELYATEMLYRKMAEGTRLQVLLPEGGTVPPETTWTITADGIIIEGADTAEQDLSLCSYVMIDNLGNEEALPLRQHPKLAWHISASCNLNMSSSSPQQLFENQLLSWTDVVTKKEIEVRGSDSERIYVQSDRAVLQNGGTDVDVTSVDTSTFRNIPLTVYTYKVRKSDKSKTSESNNYDVVWKFTDNSVTASGHNVSLTNIKLTEGTYVLPIQMQQVTGNVKVYWTLMRSIKDSKLTDNEKAKLVEILTCFPSGGVTSDSLNLWHSAGKPVEFSDVLAWIYGHANIDVTPVFKNYSITELFSQLFIPQSADANVYKYAEGTTDLAKMCLSKFGDPEIDISNPNNLVFDAENETVSDNLTKAAAVLETGDILFIHTPNVSETLPDSWNSYIAIVDGVGLSFVTVNQHTSSLEALTMTQITDRLDNLFDEFDTLDEEKSLAKKLDSYGFILRPSNCTNVIGDDKNLSLTECQTVTNITANKNMTYYFPVTVESSTNSYILSIVQENSTSTLTPAFTIGNMRNVTYPKLLSSSAGSLSLEFLTTIKSHIRDLDLTGRFDFMHEVLDADLVAHPLDAVSFLDESHIMNPFTICQYVLPASALREDLVVVSKAR